MSPFGGTINNNHKNNTGWMESAASEGHNSQQARKRAKRSFSFSREMKQKLLNPPPRHCVEAILPLHQMGRRLCAGE